MNGYELPLLGGEGRGEGEPQTIFAFFFRRLFLQSSWKSLRYLKNICPIPEMENQPFHMDNFPMAWQSPRALD